MFQENCIETCIVSRGKQITSAGWMHETSARDLVHWENLEGAGGEGGGRGDQDGNTCKPMAVSFQCMIVQHADRLQVQ